MNRKAALFVVIVQSTLMAQTCLAQTSNPLDKMLGLLKDSQKVINQASNPDPNLSLSSPEKPTGLAENPQTGLSSSSPSQQAAPVTPKDSGPVSQLPNGCGMTNPPQTHYQCEKFVNKEYACSKRLVPSVITTIRDGAAGKTVSIFDNGKKANAAPTDSEWVKSIDVLLNRDILYRCKPDVREKSSGYSLASCFVGPDESYNDETASGRCKQWVLNDAMKQAAPSEYERYIAIKQKTKSDFEQAKKRDLNLGFKSLTLFQAESEIVKTGKFDCQKKSAQLTECAPKYSERQECESLFVPALGTNRNVCNTVTTNLAGDEWNSVAGFRIDVKKARLTIFDGRLVRMHIPFIGQLSKAQHQEVVLALRERYGHETNSNPDFPTWNDKNGSLLVHSIALNLGADQSIIAKVDEHKRMLEMTDKDKAAAESAARKQSETRLRSKDL